LDAGFVHLFPGDVGRSPEMSVKTPAQKPEAGDIRERECFDRFEQNFYRETHRASPSVRIFLFDNKGAVE